MKSSTASSQPQRRLRRRWPVMALFAAGLLIVGCGSETGNATQTTAADSVEGSSTTKPSTTQSTGANSNAVVESSSGSNRKAVYEVLNAETGDVLSRHSTRQAALDSWRMDFTDVKVEIWRREVPSGDVLIVEGVWHESTRPG